MATRLIPEIDYPSSDGKPVGETPFHRDNLLYMVYMLKRRYAKNRRVYVSGNMFMYYEPGNKRKHVSPDVFVVLGIPKLPERKVFLLWKEGKGPDFITEVTSKSTRKEDLKEKFHLYQDVLKVQEYFLFDPEHEYLDPLLQGYRLGDGKYQRIQAVDGRLPSQVLGLLLEVDGWMLRLYDPKANSWLATPEEEFEQHLAEREQHLAEREQHLAEREQHLAEREQHLAALAREKAAREQAEAELERLRRLQRKNSGKHD